MAIPVPGCGVVVLTIGGVGVVAFAIVGVPAAALVGEVEFTNAENPGALGAFVGVVADVGARVVAAVGVGVIPNIFAIC